MTAQEIKALPFDKKADYFINLMFDMTSDNPVDILNVYRLVNSYNTFDDSFFDDPNSYITDISEFIDLKMELEEPINAFTQQVIFWFLSSIASCDIKAETDPENMYDMPMLVYGFLVQATLPVISAMMRSIDMSEIDMNELYTVKGAFYLVSRMMQSHSFVASYLEKL